jgi:hypothetical protein
MLGKDITIPKGTEITAYVNGDFKFDAERFQRRTALQAGTARTPIKEMTEQGRGSTRTFARIQRPAPVFA